MGRWGHLRKGRVVATAVVALGLVSIASAQVSDGGKALRLTLGQTLAYSDNIDLVAEPGGDTLRSTTRLGLNYSDITRTQRLEFAAGGAYEADTDNETDFTDPFARLSYALEGRNNRLEFTADYRRVDLDDLSIPLSLLLPGVALPDQIVNDVAQIEAGLRSDTSYTLEAETGLQSAFGLRLELSSRDRRYNDEQIFDLANTQSRRAEVESTFRIDPSLTARIVGVVSRFEGEDAQETRRFNTSLGVGIEYELTPANTLDLFIGQRRIEVERNGINSSSRGPEVMASLVRDMPNGDLTFSLNSRQTLERRDTVVRVSRSQTLSRDGQLTYSVGASRAEGLDTEPLFELAYIKPLRRGRFNIELGQEARTREISDEPVVLTRLSAGYGVKLTKRMDFSIRASLDDLVARVKSNQDRRSYLLRTDLVGQINDISSWSLGASIDDTRVVESGITTTQQRYGVQLGYRRALTSDWNMVAQYQHSAILDSDVADRRSNTISFGLERSFDTRF